MFYYVYILESMSHPDKHYVGITVNLKRRLQKHNQGGSRYTSQYIP